MSAQPSIITPQTTITLKQARDKSARSGHPWIFSGAIERTQGEKPKEGSLVKVLDNSGTVLGVGLFGSRTIAVKLLSFNDEQIDAAFFIHRLEHALALRKTLQLTTNDQELNCFRLVHGEGDFLPGLVVDRYGDVLSVEYHSIGYQQFETQLIEALRNILPDTKAILIRSSANDDARFVFGESRESVDVVECGVKLSVPVAKGQKTGYFLDQRDNRVLIGELARGKSVLDLFSYIGGFALHAAIRGASAVTAVDSSKAAVELIKQNAERNSAKVTAVAKDVFAYLEDPRHPNADIVIVDPPAFVKQRQSLGSGKKGYVRLNKAAIDKVKPGGLMATFSCSQLVSEEDFLEIVKQAALLSGRSVQLIQKLGQAGCHPTSIAHSEARYLKGLLVCVS